MDNNYKLLRVLQNCRMFDFDCARSGRKNPLITRILLLQARDAAAKADKDFVKMVFE